VRSRMSYADEQASSKHITRLRQLKIKLPMELLKFLKVARLYPKVLGNSEIEINALA
jgi:hypothetical protein